MRSMSNLESSSPDGMHYSKAPFNYEF